MASLADVTEVKGLISNLEWLSGKIPTVISNWKKVVTSCSRDVVDSTGVIRDICEQSTAKPVVFDPLLRWLQDWVKIRENKIALTKVATDNFIKIGLRAMYKYAVFARFLIANIDYWIPHEGAFGLASVQETVKKQQQYSEFVILLSQKIIGCLNDLAFRFLPLSRTVANKSPELTEFEEYLDQTCLSLRLEKLKLK